MSTLPLYVEEILVTVRERNRAAGYSYGARTAESRYVAHFADGSTTESEYLNKDWAHLLRPYTPQPKENAGQ